MDLTRPRENGRTGGARKPEPGISADEDISAKWRFGPGPLLLRLLRRKTQLGLRLGGR